MRFDMQKLNIVVSGPSKSGKTKIVELIKELLKKNGCAVSHEAHENQHDGKISNKDIIVEISETLHQETKCRKVKYVNRK